VSVNVDSWEKATNQRIGPTLANASVGSAKMVRASLLKADTLMRALGRPNRDQIVTSRPGELTTLEAVNLATSNALAANLAAGAGRFLDAGDALVDEIYLAMLTRFPTERERSIASAALGNQPDRAAVADLLWALTMTPEFLILR
jgi:hypothetical protein